MKKLYVFSLLVFLFTQSNLLLSQTPNGLCITSQQFCTGTTYNFPAGVNTGNGEAGPDYGCLGTQPNPVWYYIQVAESGNIELEMQSLPQNDIDFVCWGPFTSTSDPCNGLLTSNGNVVTHEGPGPSPTFPSGNTIDCSYSVAFQEYCYIPNAIAGQYYIVMITNFSNQVCNIIFTQSNSTQVGAGTTICGYAADVTGTVYYDLNSNGVQDANEIGAPGVITGSPSCTFYTMTDSAGDYVGHVCYTPDNFYAYYTNPYTTINPGSYPISDNTSNADFAITLVPNISDFSIDITNVTPAVPGFDMPVAITVSNEGTIDPNCGSVSFTFDTLFDFVSSAPPADSVINNTVYWGNICAGYFQSTQLSVLLNTDSTAVIDTPYNLFGSVNLSAGDTNLADNNDTIADIVVSSYDPNDKQVNPSGQIGNAYAATEPEFVYTIRFQNTGTYNATNIRVRDSLSTWLNPTSFRIISSSHPCTASMTGQGIVDFNFNNINLPDVNSNEPGSHGFVKFAVKCNAQLENGGNVYNTSYIYFDFNPAIITNTVLTYTKPIITNIPNSKVIVREIAIDPNPANDIVNVSINLPTNETLKLDIVDFQGQVVSTQFVEKSNREFQINVSNLKPGAYTIHITGEKKSYNQVLIKQ